MEIFEETVGIMEDYGTFKLHLVNVGSLIFLSYTKGLSEHLCCFWGKHANCS